MTTSDDYPGRMMKDAERSMFGLGWEHKRRGEKPEPRYMARGDYMAGWGGFNCSDAKTNRAMLERGVSISKSCDLEG